MSHLLGTVAPMALAARDRAMTAEEFFATTDELPNAQLIDGELVVVNSPAARHNRIIFDLVFGFGLLAQDRPGLGELGAAADVRIDDHNVFVPDLWWVPEERRLDDDASRFSAPPPLVVEVRSPPTWRYDVGPKLRHYETAGVAEVWLIDTAADAVLVYRRSDDGSPTFDVSLELTADETLTTPLIPGWTIDLGELFAR